MKKHIVIDTVIGFLTWLGFIIIALFTIGKLSPSGLQFPSPFEVFTDFFKAFIDKNVIKAMLNTIYYVFISISLSVIIGVILSFLLHINKRVWKAFTPTIDFLRSIPVTFFIPAFALLLGVSSPNIIWILTVIPSTLVILVNVSTGISRQNKSRIHQYILYSGSSNKMKIFRKITIYEVIPYLISGIKIALSYAIVIVTVLEYMRMGNHIGLGTLVTEEMEQLNYPRVYSVILIVGFLGYFFNKIFERISLKFKN